MLHTPAHKQTEQDVQLHLFMIVDEHDNIIGQEYGLDGVSAAWHFAERHPEYDLGSIFAATIH